MCRFASMLHSFMLRHSFCGSVVGKFLADVTEGEVPPTEHLSALQDFSKGTALQLSVSAAPPTDESKSHSGLQIYKPNQV